MSAISVEKMGTIDVGRQGENLARTIEFDVSSLLAKWPGAKITLLVKRKGDPEPYFAEAKVEGHILKWPITEVETAVAGDGKIEIQAILGEVIEKTVTATFRVSASLSGSASEELPEVRPSWVDEVLAAAGSGGGSGGAGEGAFIVTATRDEEGRLYADKTQDEIRAAVAAGEMCFLVDDEGQVYSYEGDVYNGTLRETCPTFARPAGYVSSERITFHRRQVTSSKNVTGMSSTLPLPTEPHQQFVSNKNGYPQWEERTHYKETTTEEVVNLPETAAAAYDDDNGDGANDMAIFATPWSVDIVAGNTYTVTWNGVEFECPAIAAEEVGGGIPVEGCTVMGNLSYTGVEGLNGNPDAPFMMMCIPNDGAALMDGMTCVAMFMESTETVTISVCGVVTTTVYKELEEGYLPASVRKGSGKQITITIDENDIITSDMSFQAAWEMTAAQLQAAIAIKTTSVYKGECYTSPETVAKSSGSMWGQSIVMRFRQPFIDTSDIGDVDDTMYLTWSVNGIYVDERALSGLPILTVSQEGSYLRHNGSRWAHYTLEQAKEEMGSVCVANLTISGSTYSIDKSLQTIISAVESGKIVFLRNVSEGSVTILPLVNYTSSSTPPRVVFQVAVSGVEITVTYTSTGVTVDTVQN